MDILFRKQTGTTYPLLLEGGPVARAYGLDRENFVVVDHEGVIRYNSANTGRLGIRFDNRAIRAAIAAALQAVPVQEPEEMEPGGAESAVEAESWGKIKLE